MRGDDLIGAAPSSFPFGTSLVVTARGKRIKELGIQLVNSFANPISEVSERLGKKNVRDLEKIATAAYVTEELGLDISKEERVKRVIGYKKHVSVEEAKVAIEEYDSLASILKESL